jgi:hypothetical protein
MKEVVIEVSRQTPLELEEVDVDGSQELREKFGAEVPVLFINGRKAFKYQVSAKSLKSKLKERRLISWTGCSG